MARYTVRCGAAETWFSVVAAAKPDCTLTVQVTEQDSKAALDGVEIRLGPFHARTDKAGRAELRVCKGEYQLQLWRTAHISPADQCRSSVELTMARAEDIRRADRWIARVPARMATPTPTLGAEG